MSSCNVKLIISLLLAVLLVLALTIIIINLFSPTLIGGIQAELTNAGGTTIADGDNVLFNTVLNDQSSNISYDAATGEFTLAQPGNYLISWWVGTDGAGPAVNVSFAVAVNGVPYSTASSPIVSGQLSGDALVTVGAAPSVVSLVNVTTEGVFVPTTPVQANIVITEILD